MNWLQAVWHHVITAYVIAVASALKRDVTSRSNMAADRCPDDYWDESSKRCARPLVTNLEILHPFDSLNNWTLSDHRDINRTCASWHHTSVCYQHLMRLCQSNGRAHGEIRTHLQRYSLFSATCSPSLFRNRKKLIECFLPYIKPTLTCTEAFEKYFRNYVAEKQYRNACRVVNTAMKCFLEIQTEVNDRCPDDVTTFAAHEYQLMFILPLVEQTRDTIVNVARCSISPPCDAYFVVGAATHSERRRNRTVEAYSAALVALLFTTWQHRVLR